MGKSGVLIWGFEVQNTEKSCQMVIEEKDERMLGGRSRTLASHTMGVLLRLEAIQTMSEQGRIAGGDGERNKRLEGNSSVNGGAPAEGT